MEVTRDVGIMERFKHIYVKEVVREPRMHFQRVPRLGCFMAVPLVYRSCLFDDSLTESVANYRDVMERRALQDQEREAFE